MPPANTSSVAPEAPKQTWKSLLPKGCAEALIKGQGAAEKPVWDGHLRVAEEATAKN